MHVSFSPPFGRSPLAGTPPDCWFRWLRYWLLLLATGAAWAAAESPALPDFDAAAGRGKPAWLENAAACRSERRAGLVCLCLPEDQDPYERVEWRVNLGNQATLAGGRRLVRIEFYDEGAGVIEPRLVRGRAPATTTLSAIRRCSYTRLNTRTLREAWFEFDLPAATTGADGAGWQLRIGGLQFLRRIRVEPSPEAAAWEAQRGRVPRRVEPMVKLRRPIELVTTAGVDVQGDASTLAASIEAMRELAPLARVLGFTSIESYVTWKRLEPRREGEFDFGFYDEVTRVLQEYGLKWFPLLIVGSGYALPDWFLEHPEMAGFMCLEHGRSNSIQSIWHPAQRRHVTRVLQAFGRHYEPMGVLEGVRLGPSGNYGESQYPAGGSWGAKGEKMHIHIGWWAADPEARADFRRWLGARYGRIEELNRAWDADYRDFAAVEPVLPQVMTSRRQRMDFTAWYTDSMTDWCGWWAHEARRALPRTPIYQSAGGWGFREAGTDYSAQTKSMTEVDGGVRLTNETDSYEQNFYATQLAVSAARLYGVRRGFEPASSHTARGTVGRIFHTMASDGDHLFTYHDNLFGHPMAIARWLKYLPVLDERGETVRDVAVYYPETENQLADAPFRHLYAWGFNPVAREVRRVVDVDYLDDRLIREGFLDRYRVLVVAWGQHMEADVQRRLDTWLRAGGTLIYPGFPRGPQETIEGDTTLFRRWSEGDVGRGRLARFKGDAEPPELYGRFVRDVLATTPGLHPVTRAALATERGPHVFLVAQPGGRLLALNYDDAPARVRLRGRFDTRIEPYGVAVLPAR